MKEDVMVKYLDDLNDCQSQLFYMGISDLSIIKILNQIKNGIFSP